MGGKVLENTSVGESIPYHPFFKLIFDNPPTGIEFVESYTGQDAKAFNKFIRKFKNICIKNGVDRADVNEFVSSRNVKALKTMNADLPVWCGVVPYFLGPNDWVLETEDCWHFFEPWFGNNRNEHANLETSPYTTILRCLFEMDNCKGIITHTKDSLNFIRAVFGNKVLSKSFFCQQAVKINKRFLKPPIQQNKQEVRFLFHGSWNHSIFNFLVRGGYDVLHCFDSAYKINNNIRLVFVHDEKKLTYARDTDDSPNSTMVQLVESIKSHPGIEYHGNYVSDKKLDEIRQSVDIFLLPSYRLHSMSCLRSMCLGKPVVCSDGWGFDEYITNWYNGVICEGNQASHIDDQGIMRETYGKCVGRVQTDLCENVIRAMLTLAESPELRDIMSQNCINEYNTRYNIKDRNKVLGQILNKCFQKV